VGLSARDINDAARLAQLAADPQGASRADIYLAIASLYRNQCDLLSHRERTLMREILERLTIDVEMAIRIALAERLADDPKAPLELILLFVDDRIEVARPIILRSHILGDSDLLRLVAEADVARQTACAERSHIGARVTAALADSDAEPVLVALVRNVSAQIAPATFETLVEKSRTYEAMQEPLVKREDLPAPLAQRMCEWVSDALKSYLMESGRFAPRSAQDVLRAATEAVQSPQPALSSEAESSAGKLVEKLAGAGQLRAGFLLRVLQQGQIDLFDIAFARLLDLQVQDFRRSFYESGPRPVALACRAVGIDKSVFGTVFHLSRRANGLPPPLTLQEQGEVERAFVALSKPEAKAQLLTAA